ncbi:MAG: phosphate starvation-inducible protein PhoH [Planctomycetaceae bacterium]|nr:phosphate starvation-inducible protein PhoH [Planctomycetaceae bacterium]
MSEATISFTNHDQIRTLFGAQDENLRRVRDSVGIDVVMQGDQLRLLGTQEQIERGLEVFSELRAIVEHSGRLKRSELAKVLNQTDDDTQPHAPADVDFFDPTSKIKPRTQGQAGYLKAMQENDLVFCTGPAGCGKTFLAVATAISAMRREQVRKIVLVRPAVEAGEKLGFLPGDMLAKVNPYLRPLLDALAEIIGFDQVQRYMENDVIEIVPLAFMRGRTLNETYIILDEAQNTTITQMKMFLTRMGTRSKIAVTGDITQIDLPGDVSCGLTDAINRFSRIDGVGLVRLTRRDIVRHRLVSDIVDAYDDRRKSHK